MITIFSLAQQELPFFKICLPILQTQLEREPSLTITNLLYFLGEGIFKNVLAICLALLAHLPQNISTLLIAKAMKMAESHPITFIFCTQSLCTITQWALNYIRIWLCMIEWWYKWTKILKLYTLILLFSPLP